MIVNINNSTYEMNSKQYKAVLDTASKAVTCGIYAIEKNKVAIMLREEYKSKEELKQAVGNYTAKGFKVHWNEKSKKIEIDCTDGLKIVIDGEKMDLSGVKSMQIDLEIEHKTICIDRREVMILEN